MLNTVNSC